MLLPKGGRKIADWLLRGFIQCANIQVLIARSITASVHKLGGCEYDDVSVRIVEISDLSDNWCIASIKDDSFIRIYHRTF